MVVPKLFLILIFINFSWSKLALEDQVLNYNNAFNYFSLQDDVSNLNCSEALQSIVNSFLFNPLTKITAKYSAKIYNDMGNYYLCSSNPATHYYSIFVEHFIITLGFGICVPQECSTEDIQTIRTPLSKALSSIAKSIAPANAQVDVSVPPEYIRVSDPLNEQKEFRHSIRAGIIAIILIFVIFFIFNIISSYINNRKPNTALQKVISSFNFKKNFEDYFTNKVQGEDGIKCLNGLRIIFMSWVVLGHTFSNGKKYPPSNILGIYNLLIEFKYAYIYNSTLAVDGFFFLSAFLLCYLLIKQIDRAKGKVNLLLVVIHRLIRLYPAMIMSILTTTYVLPFLSSGPIYFELVETSTICMSAYYKIILFFNNFLKLSDLYCNGWTWYLAIDFQFFIISIFLILFTYNKPKIFIPIIFFMIFGSFIEQIWLFLHYDIYTAVTRETPAYWDIYYEFPQNRISTWALGLLAGYHYFKLQEGKSEFVKSISKHVNTSTLTRICMYIFSLSGMFILIFAMYYFNKYTEETPRWIDVLYLATYRCGFIFCLWMSIFPSIVGTPNLITNILGKDFFAILSKSSYSVYQFHLVIFWHFLFDAKHSFQYDAGYLQITAFCIWISAITFATFLYIFIETPIFNLENYFLMPARRPVQKSIETVPFKSKEENVEV